MSTAKPKRDEPQVISANLIRLTNERFWERTGYKPGQALIPTDPDDRKMMPRWLSIYHEVARELVSQEQADGRAYREEAGHPDPDAATVVPDLPLASIIETANRDKYGSYLTVDFRHLDGFPVIDGDDGVIARLRGDRKITLFSTLRNARTPPDIGDMQESEQVVMLLDLDFLLILLPEAIPLEKNQAGFSEAALAERQTEQWTARAERFATEQPGTKEAELAHRQADLWTKRTERLMKERG